ncbi:hypothetical protein RSA37_11765 [Mammaliicoccus sciuri]|uniref:YopX family protein n=1 Tax=Mammaliicoccus sciuri TaxID=1296 RepID=UPI000733E22A|nr:YopX family protein [Mammaliicoccus sciuri]KTT82707.1 hypothetical protein NS1R_12025 [Mammaliicoccus sciuri]KTT88236.1 hypothetical protein NS112_09465 [Mammaliicoccus sciuri]KTT89779.1 hypothetical protein NS36R_07990 [Mammaliicoccus sciuri]KTT94171.1 hypothetical protein NS44R_08405 [Mammaliicoccus sciuri]KTW10723.1 hypothetical protein RSA37_11765 [Mammaliicoccus sciuri]
MIPKFRAWDKFDKEMLDVHGINYDADGVWTKEMIDDESDGEFIHFSDIELLQSTGLFDKNGKEIFEGDIVTAMSEGIKGTGVVKRRIDGYWLMYPAWQNGQSWKLVVNEQGDTDVEIIGNKFEDGYLLGEG